MKKIKYSISIILISNCFVAQEDTIKKSNLFTLHFQETTVSQYRPIFNASYSGSHSQIPVGEWATTITSTLFFGMKLWNNASIIINPEIAGGHGLSSAFGIAAFTNGEAFRVGNPDPTFYLARASFKQIISLSKEKIWQSEGENKLKQWIPKKQLVLTLGKVSIADYFDDNSFSHNPRTQFLSWGLMSNGAWDYPANTRGYTPSIIAEYISPKIEIRYALSMVPKTANGNIMDNNISKANANSLEIKYKYRLKKQQGKISLIGFYNSAFMGSYASANNYKTYYRDFPPYGDTTLYSIENSRQYGRSKFGFGLNIEQNITKDIGLFSRVSYNDGKNETWCFTEIDKAISIGTLIKGTKWKRENDLFGIAYCLSGLSNEHAHYLSNGGLGFILGDGKINYSNEHVIESFYSCSLLNGKIIPSLSYQLIVNPGNNKDRGPINVYSIRMHISI
jgi:high affinity Mn2+ porin